MALPEPAIPDSYRTLDEAGVRLLLNGLDSVRIQLGGCAADWRIREVGDGNLNLVFLVDGAEGSVCVKQAVPYVRVAGPSWPMALERAGFENAYFRSVAPHVLGRVPQIHHYDAALFCTVMERLSPHVILRHGLIGGCRYPTAAGDIGEYVARACFFTSNLAAPFERKAQGLALFAGNTALMRITVDLVFTDPYRDSERNRHTSPQLDDLVAGLRRDAPLKVAAARFGWKLLNDVQALLHGDLHSGSVMVCEHDTRVIDPEFAFYGPIGFDLGAFFGNLLLSWYAQPGHASADDDRAAYRTWILDQAVIFWQTFRRNFLALWARHGVGDGYPLSIFTHPADEHAVSAARETFVTGLFADMLGFAACKMIRRIIGFAHVADFESIPDAALRARCEAGALTLARLMLVNPERYRSIGEVIDAVPRTEQR